MRKTLPLVRLRLDPESEEARLAIGFKWAAGAGGRHQIGGEPTFLQPGAEWPVCEQCHEAMTFYGQLDSVGNDLCIADLGLVLVFMCFGCYQAKALVQTG